MENAKFRKEWKNLGKNRAWCGVVAEADEVLGVVERESERQKTTFLERENKREKAFPPSSSPLSEGRRREGSLGSS